MRSNRYENVTMEHHINDAINEDDGEEKSELVVVDYL